MKRVALLFLSGIFFTSLLMAGGLVTGASKMRFEPGDKVLFERDFHECPVGEAPEGFDKFSGAGECVKYEDHIWLAPSTNNDFRVYKKLDLGEGDFSIEYDILIHQDIGGALGPKVILRLLEGDEKEWDKAKLPHDVEAVGYYHRCGIYLEKVGRVAEIPGADKKKIHIAIQVRRKQLRVFADGKRLISVPFALSPGKHVSGFEWLWVDDTNAYGALLTNIRVAKYTKKEAKPTPEKLGIGVKKTAEGYKLTVPERVLFDFDKFILKPEAKEALASVGEFVRSHHSKKVVVTGYTDNRGSDAYNLRLSLQRAQSVADYLIYCEKIDPGLFEIEGRGKADPVASNATEEGRSKNRRVEIRIVE